MSSIRPPAGCCLRQHGLRRLPLRRLLLRHLPPRSLSYRSPQRLPSHRRPCCRRLRRNLRRRHRRRSLQSRQLHRRPLSPTRRRRPPPQRRMPRPKRSHSPPRWSCRSAAAVRSGPPHFAAAPWPSSYSTGPSHSIFPLCTMIRHSAPRPPRRCRLRRWSCSGSNRRPRCRLRRSQVHGGSPRLPVSRNSSRSERRLPIGASCYRHLRRMRLSPSPTRSTVGRCSSGRSSTVGRGCRYGGGPWSSRYCLPGLAWWWRLRAIW